MISARYQQFDAYARAVIALIRDEAARLRLAPAFRAEILAAYSIWQAAFARYVDTAARTAADTAATAAAYKTLHALLRAVRRQLKTDGAVQLTARDRIIFDLPPRAHYHFEPRPAAAGQHTVRETWPGYVIFNTMNTIDPHTKNHRRLPTDVHYLAIYLAFTDTKTPPTADQFQRVGDDATHMTFRVDIPPEHRGKIGWLVTAFMNRRGQQGPKSVALMFRTL